jgi:glyoxylase-like metal-dependent hydrolase (beta-lactamase superfamily II)
MAQVIKVLPGLFKIQLPMPYTLDQVNVYLLEAEPLTLVDTGPIMRGVEADLFAALRRTGHDASELGRILITHVHADHMGLAARLREASGAEVVSHASAVEHLGDYRGTAAKGMDFMLEAAPLMGLPAEMLERNREMMTRWQDVAESVLVDRPVEEGDLLPAGRFPLRVYHTPGHSFEHVVYHQEEYGLLFSGDFLLDRITPNPDIYLPGLTDKTSGLPDYVENLERLRGLRVMQVFPGHGRCISDYRGRVAEVLLHHDQRKRYVAANLRGREMSVLELALELLAFVEAEVDPTNVFLAIREIYGHLVLLEEEGQVAREQRGGAYLYQVVDG